MKLRRSTQLFHWLFVIPALAVYGAFILYPFLSTIFLSFHKWDGFGPMEWVGLRNYYDRADDGRLYGLVADDYFRNGLRNNVVYWIVTLVSEVAVGLGLAALLVRVKRGAAVYRLALSAPLMIALVASAVLWRQILAEQGLLNGLLKSAGAGGLARNWLEDGRVVYTVSILSGWAYAGFYMLIFYAALERIPGELREAAQIDGATGWRVFAHVEFPLVRPVLAVCVLLCSTGAFRAYDLFWVIVGTGRNRQSEVVSTWLVKQAFTNKAFGPAAAMAVVMVVIVICVASVLNIWASRERELEY